MKLLALLLAAAGLSGCVAYPYAPGAYYGGQGYYGQTPYVVDSPVYIYGGGGYGYRGGDRGYRRGGGDRDRDGIPNRIDRDRDGDGVPNRQDARPYDPRRR
jgi:hypothetical protein